MGNRVASRITENQTSNTTSNRVGDGLFMDVSKQIANTGRDGIDQRTIKFSLKMTF